MGKASCSCREMNVDIAFEVTAKGMNGNEDGRGDFFGVSDGLNGSSGNKADFVEQRAIEPEEIPEFSWHGKSNMLPGGFGEGVILFVDPKFGGLFATGGTGFRLAGMRNTLDMRAGRVSTMIFMISPNSIFTAEEFGDGDGNSGSEVICVFLVEVPPVLIGEEDLFERVGHDTDKNRASEETRWRVPHSWH